MTRGGKERLIAEEAYRFLERLRPAVDRRITSWEALHICPNTGEYGEETTEGRYDYMVLTKVSKDYAQAKYGPLPTD